MGSPPPASGGLILVIWACYEAYSASFLVIQTPLPSFCLAADFLGLRRGGFSSQVINQGRHFLEQVARPGDLGQLERNAPPVIDSFRADLQAMRPSTLKSPARKPPTAVPLQATGLP